MHKIHLLFLTLAVACGLSAQTNTSSSTGVDAVALDKQWDLIEHLIAVKDAASGIGKVRTPEPYSLRIRLWQWQESTGRLLRDAGLVFSQQAPADDARKWEWFWATIHTNVEYWSDISDNAMSHQPWKIDEAARTDWEQKRLVLEAGFLAAKTVPDDQKCILRAEELKQRIRPYEFTTAGNDPGKYPWQNVGQEILQLGRDYPESKVEELRTVANIVVEKLTKWSPAGSESFVADLGKSPNGMLRELAQGRHALAGIGSPVSMAFTAVDGREVDLAKLRGKVVLINFWAATWCGACKVQEPLMCALYQKYHGEGYEMLGVTCEMNVGDRKFLLDYVRQHQMPWPQYFNGKGMDNEFVKRYGVVGIPRYLLVGKDGLLVWSGIGAYALNDFEKLLVDELRKP